MDPTVAELVAERLTAQGETVINTAESFDG